MLKMVSGVCDGAVRTAVISSGSLKCEMCVLCLTARV
jgi:hypothetical protein